MGSVVIDRIAAEASSSPLPRPAVRDISEGSPPAATLQQGGLGSRRVVTDSAPDPGRAGQDLRTFALAVVPTAAAAALQLATFVLTGRALGPETFGLVAVTYAIAAVAADVTGLGADAAMVRGVAVDPGRRADAWGHALLLFLVSYPPVAIAATAAAAVLAGPGLGIGTVALLVCGEVLVARATAAVELVQVALGRPAAAGLVRLAAVSARAATAALVFALLGASDARTWAIAAAAQSALTAALLLGLAGPVRFRPRSRLARLRAALDAERGRAVAGREPRPDRLAALLPPAAFGLYAAASRLQLVGAIANQAASRILYPRFFRAAEHGPAELAALTRTAARTMCVAGLVATTGIAVLAPVVTALLGPAFSGTTGSPRGSASPARSSPSSIRRPMRSPPAAASRCAPRSPSPGCSSRRFCSPSARARAGSTARWRGLSPRRPPWPACSGWRCTGPGDEPGGGDPTSLLCAGILSVAVAEFGQVWYYPAPEAGAEFTRAFGGAFRMALWLAASVCILLHLCAAARSPIRTLAPFVPFVIWGAAVVAFWSIDRTAGVRTLGFWTIAACLAVATACEADPRTLARGVALTFLAVVAGSLAAALLAPGAASTSYGDASMVRGLFPHKNAFGWFCALGLVWATGTRRALGPALAVVVAATMAGGLLASGSKTAAAMLPAVGAYVLALGCCQRAFANGARAARP